LQQISRSKLAKSDYSPLFVALAFRNGLNYSHSDITKLIYDDLATLPANLVNFGPVTPEFKKVTGVLVSFLKINFSDKLYLMIRLKYLTKCLSGSYSVYSLNFMKNPPITRHFANKQTGLKLKTLPLLSRGGDNHMLFAITYSHEIHSS